MTLVRFWRPTATERLAVLVLHYRRGRIVRREMKKNTLVTLVALASYKHLASLVAVLLLSPFLVLGLAGCGGSGGDTPDTGPVAEAQRIELAAKRAVRAGKNIRSYKFTAGYSAFQYYAITAEVKNEVLVSFQVTRPGSTQTPESETVRALEQEFGTVERIFQAAQSDINDQVENDLTTTVSYDDTLGYPRDVSSRPRSQTGADGFASFNILSLTPTE